MPSFVGANVKFRDGFLSEHSIVFDVGGYKGEWSQQIAERYNPYIHIFEPVPQFFHLITSKFSQNLKISTYNFGLFGENTTAPISIGGESSSIYKLTNEEVEISLMDIDDFLIRNGIQQIDLIKINIEGAEYSLLQRMINQRIVERCQDIQVQFHKFYPRAVELRDEIRSSLQSTHYLTFDYPFVWENWRRK